MLAQFERPFRVRGTEAALKQFVADGVPGLTLGRLAHLRVPRAVLWGAADTVDSLGSGRTTAAALHAKLEIIGGAGHLSMLARPRSTARRILGFVTSLSSHSLSHDRAARARSGLAS